MFFGQTAAASDFQHGWLCTSTARKFCCKAGRNETEKSARMSDLTCCRL